MVDKAISFTNDVPSAPSEGSWSINRKMQYNGNSFHLILVLIQCTIIALMRTQYSHVTRKPNRHVNVSPTQHMNLHGAISYNW